MSGYGYETGYRYRRYRKPLRIKKFVIAAILLAVVILAFVWFQCGVLRLLISLSEENSRAKMAEAVNEAALQTMQWNGIEYDKLVSVERNDQGEILSIEANSYQINLLARQTQTLATANVNAVCEEGIPVPLGAFTGISALAGFGPEITFRVLQVGSVICSFESEFTSAGINQTRHCVYMFADASVSIVLPSQTKKVAIRTQILVCESIIVGKIPEIYLNGGWITT